MMARSGRRFRPATSQPTPSDSAISTARKSMDWTETEWRG